MWTTIECAGHPRDMGLAQGAAAQRMIRQEVGAAGLASRRSRWPSLSPLGSGPLRGRGAGRELFRHFAHQAERLEGLARAADLPIDALLELHLRVRAGGADGGLLARRSTLRAHSEGESGGAKRALLERSLPRPISGESGWILRESRPVVGFRSIEVTLPWLVSSVAGVNEAGLAVVAGPLLWGMGGRGGDAPSHLLVQECLQRFEDLEGAIDWCRKRPVEGEQSFVLADASGGVATVIASGRTRRVQAGEGELYLEGGEPASPLESDANGLASDAAIAVDRVRLDAADRRLRLDAAGVTIDVGLAE